MASFDIAYRTYILPNEGGYANVTNDKGGETYAGIARNFFPQWPGWTFIDFEKRTKGPISHNKKFPDIQHMVDEFYLGRWNLYRFGEINSQELANLFFDFFIHSGTTAVKIMQRLVNVTADGIVGPMTIAAINKANAAQLHDKLKAERGKLFEALIQKDPTQEKFRQGWFKRLASFPDMTKGGIAALLIVGVLIYFLWKSPEPEGKKKIYNRAIAA